MSELLIVLLAASGITFSLQHKLPFLQGKFSIIDSMLTCTFCTGFHAGWIAYLLAKAPSISIQELLLFGFSSAIFSYTLDEFIKYLEEANGDQSD